MTRLVLSLVLLLAARPAITASFQQPAAQSTAASTAQDVDVLLTEAWKLLEGGKAADAKAAFERALEGARRLALEPQQARALCGISDALSRTTQYGDARDFALRCLELYERLSLPAGIGRANILLNFAAELSGNLAEAKTRAELAIAAFESAGDLDRSSERDAESVPRGQSRRSRGGPPPCASIEDARAAGARGSRGERRTWLGRRALQPGPIRRSLRQARARKEALRGA